MVLPQAIGSAISTFVSCVKLLGKYNLQGLLCVQQSGNCILQGFALCLALGSSNSQGIVCLKLLGYCNLEAAFARLCVAPRYWGITCQAIGELQLAGFCFASSYCGMIIALHFPKLLPHYNFRVCVKLLGNSNLQGVALPQPVGELQFAWSCFAPSYWGITITTGTGDSGSSYFLDTRNQFSIAIHHVYILSAPLHAAIPVHLLWSLKHPPSCGESISSYFLNTPLHLAIQVHLSS